MKSRVVSFLTLVLLSAFALCHTSSGQTGDSRTFTSSEGKKLTGKVLAVFGQTSVLTTNGREYAVPFSRLSEPDQAYLQSWAKKYANHPTSLFEIKLAEKMENKEKKEGSNMTVETEQWVYEISVANKLPESISGVQLECAVLRYDAHFGPNDEKQNFLMVNLSDQKIGQGTEPTQLKTRPFNIINSKEKGGKKPEDKLIGLWIRLVHDDRIIAEKKSDAKELVEAKWPSQN